MNWIIQAYADVYKVMLGDTETFKSGRKCDQPAGLRDKSRWQANRK